MAWNLSSIADKKLQAIPTMLARVWEAGCTAKEKEQRMWKTNPPQSQDETNKEDTNGAQGRIEDSAAALLFPRSRYAPRTRRIHRQCLATLQPLMSLICFPLVRPVTVTKL